MVHPTALSLPSVTALSLPPVTALSLPLELATRLSTLDLALVALYLVAITLFGLTFAKRGKKSASLKTYFLADNTIPWWAIALSIVSAETSTLTIISVPGVAFAGNFGFLQLVLGYMVGRVVVAILFLPRYFRGEMLTAYQLIDRRFGPVLHKVTAGLFLLTRAAAEGVRVFAISIVVSIAIDIGDVKAIALITTLTLLYTFEGGLAAVIWTDVAQMALYIVGTIAAILTLGHQIPGGWQHIVAVAQPLGKFHMLDFAFNLTQTYTFWAGLLGGTFLTMASHGTDQLMVQRMLAARNLTGARLALLSSGVVIFFQFTLFLLIGAGLFVFYGLHPQTFSGSDRIFPTFIVQQMPHGIAGLLVAAILAAAMSNLSAALNSLSSTTVIDFYVPFRTWKLQKKHVILREAKNPCILPESARPLATNTDRVSRLSTLVWAVVLFAIAVYSIRAGGKGHVVETGLSIASVAYGSLLGVFLLGTLTRYATQWATIAAMLCGFLLNLYLWQGSFPITIGPLTIPHIAYTWYVLIGALVTFALGLIFSAISRLHRPATVVGILPLLLALSIATCGGPAFAAVCSSSTPPKHHVIFSEAKNPCISSLPLHVHLLPSATPDFTPISTLINEAIAQHQLPGAVALIGHNEKVVFDQAYGLRKLAGEPGLDGTPSAAEPMTEDTIFDMASLTKVLVTTTAILQLYETGKFDPILGLDTPVAKYLPEFVSTTSIKEVAQTPAQNHVSLSEAKNPCISSLSTPASSPTCYKSTITIRQLLTHYSGLPEDISLKDDWGLRTPDKAEGIRRAMASTPYGPPGVLFKYSDINFITLGYLVEKLSGQPLEDYARQQIFAPLRMGNSQYLPIARACGSAQTLPPYSRAAIFGDPHVQKGIADCRGKQWPALLILPLVAPTAHDDESKANPALNPNFDHLLRGTVHDPTTRRMGGVAGHAGLFSTAADVSKFCQALLDKLLHNTGPFPLRQSTLALAISPQAPSTAVKTATIFTPNGQTTSGIAQRGLGWDLNSAFSRPRGAIFPITTTSTPGSFGHTGFTGTSIWIDPTSDTYVIVLANAIHPRGGSPISALRGQIATAAAKALGLDTEQPRANLSIAPPQEHVIPSEANNPCISASSDSCNTLGAPLIASSAIGGPSSQPRPSASDPTRTQVEEFGRGLVPSKNQASLDRVTTSTLTGIDILESTHFAPLSPYHHIGLLTNQSGIDAHGTRTIDVLARAHIPIDVIFTPEHGLLARQDTEHLASETDEATKIPVQSLYGPKPSDKHPRQSDLKKLDAVVIDLQDAGVRFWTYETVMGYFLQDCARAHVPVIVLDRPNPIGGAPAQGPLSDPGAESYIDFMPLPVRHGLTFGELALYFNANAILSGIYPDTNQADPESIHVGSGAGASATGSNIVPPATLPGLHAALTVIKMQNWTRTQYFADTGLPWLPPSPNMRTPATNIVYPAVALMETTNMSVGRGSPAPYANFGAPFVNSNELAAYLTARRIPGVTVTATTLPIADDPNQYPFHGQTVPAIHLEVTDRNALDTPELGIELLSALQHNYPAQFQLEKAKTILKNGHVLADLKAGKDPRDIAATWAIPLKAFNVQRQQYLLYP